jgi:hypothetical protein
MLSKPSSTIERAVRQGNALGTEPSHKAVQLRFRNGMVHQRSSPHTVKTYKSALKMFVNHLGNLLPESAIDCCGVHNVPPRQSRHVLCGPQPNSQSGASSLRRVQRHRFIQKQWSVHAKRHDIGSKSRSTPLRQIGT